MAHINLPDGTVVIDDSELYPDHQARRMAHEGQTPAEIADELEERLDIVQGWIQEGPYESPEAYWLRRYNAGTHRGAEDE
ncbi:hypothetical protein [Pseudomonas syringae]|uniref:3-oxoacyl-ACP reductase domain of yeast-type FAS1 n=1 Tax=Pseudomonas syringae pv. actinidiae TaxID=103796 RepID=A0A2V0QT74_PSESF|nr:hypothetical protein [Pseudomonas syringae]EPN17533.1 hypothetical protein A259_12561 [Pseudomonas syringae pv. actinidiae ICMP 19070]AQL38748.1 hypothetical protein JN853_21550 [Pseudomonas syringae pv. actinidiae ICMP 9853]EPM50789.1 hypothetical protein A256_17541 [Pseudomonas syringae pv. actinidiae ICMP 19103]EPM86127.1 hypothetical protein A260_17843 [Pseudomonas syringae pv. actinidiae ICMP 19068]EPM95206.1 hypothetical protein A258_17835 [Pseudomonas syringae pv. actinidiae ICMP 191